MNPNFAFAGYISDSSGLPADGVNYQLYFRRVNGGSSPSAWGPVRQTAFGGYWSENLINVLTYDGTANLGDEVIVCAWKGSTTRDDPEHAEWSFTHQTIAADTTRVDFSVVPNQAPQTALVTASPARRTVSQVVQNLSTDSQSGREGDDTHDWHQAAAHNGVSLFPSVAGIDNVLVDYGDGQSVVLVGTANGSHAWAAVGVYDVVATATDLQLTEDPTPWTGQVHVLYRAPTAGFTWAPPAPTVFDEVTFTPDYTDPDARVTSADWYVDGELVAAGVLPGTPFPYQFATNGAHTVRLVLHWNDNEADQTADTGNVTVTVANVLPVVGWDVTQEPANAEKFTWVSTAYDPDGGGAPPANYAWTLERFRLGDWAFEASASGAGMSSFVYTFSTPGLYRLTHSATDEDGGTSSYGGSPDGEFTVIITASGIITVVIPMAPQ